MYLFFKNNSQAKKYHSIYRMSCYNLITYRDPGDRRSILKQAENIPGQKKLNTEMKLLNIFEGF